MPKPLFVTVSVTGSVLFILTRCFAGSDIQLPEGSRSRGLANASVAIGDFWSLQNNQAGLVSLKSPALAIAYQNRYLVGELSLRSAGAAIPVLSGVFGINYRYFGYSAYNESKIGLAYAKSFGSGFSTGIQLDYLAYRLAGDYGDQHVFTFEIGILKKINEKLAIGAHAFNPVNVSLGTAQEDRVAAVYRLGISWLVSDDLMLVTETEKNMDYKPLIRAGLEYGIAQMAKVRVGYSSIPALTGSEKFSVSSEFAFGFGLHFGNLDIDFAATIHQQLGWSPSVSLIYRLKSRK